MNRFRQELNASCINLDGLKRLAFNGIPDRDNLRAVVWKVGAWEPCFFDGEGAWVHHGGGHRHQHVKTGCLGHAAPCHESAQHELPCPEMALKMALCPALPFLRPRCCCTTCPPAPRTGRRRWPGGGPSTTCSAMWVLWQQAPLCSGVWGRLTWPGPCSQAAGHALVRGSGLAWPCRSCVPASLALSRRLQELMIDPQPNFCSQPPHLLTFPLLTGADHRPQSLPGAGAGAAQRGAGGGGGGAAG